MSQVSPTKRKLRTKRNDHLSDMVNPPSSGEFERLLEDMVKSELLARKRKKTPHRKDAGPSQADRSTDTDAQGKQHPMGITETCLPHADAACNSRIPAILSLDIITNDRKGHPVSIKLTEAWRQAHGLDSYLAMVESVLDLGASYEFPEQAERYEPGRLTLPLHANQLAALSLPHIPTFLGMDGRVFAFPHEGGHA